MSIDKNKIKTQDEMDEPAPMDQAEQRVEAEMKELEDKAKRDVAEGLKSRMSLNRRTELCTWIFVLCLKPSTRSDQLFSTNASSSACLSCGGVSLGIETDKPSYDAAVARDDETLRDRSSSLHQCLRHFARRPTDVVIDFILTHKVHHPLRRRFRIFSGESNHLHTAALKLLVKFYQLRSFHPAWTTPGGPQLTSKTFPE